MAIAKKQLAEVSNNNSRVPTRGGRQQAETVGYFNLKLKDKNGNEYSLPRGIPLTGVDRVTAGMLKKAEQDPDHVFEVTGTINFVNDDDVEF